MARAARAGRFGHVYVTSWFRVRGVGFPGHGAMRLGPEGYGPGPESAAGHHLAPPSNRRWSCRWDSDPRPAHYECAALPAEPRQRASGLDFLELPGFLMYKKRAGGRPGGNQPSVWIQIVDDHDFTLCPCRALSVFHFWGNLFSIYAPWIGTGGLWPLFASFNPHSPHGE